MTAEEYCGNLKEIFADSKVWSSSSLKCGQIKLIKQRSVMLTYQEYELQIFSIITNMP